jgi:hypothetical protein
MHLWYDEILSAFYFFAIPCCSLWNSSLSTWCNISTDCTTVGSRSPPLNSASAACDCSWIVGHSEVFQKVFWHMHIIWLLFMSQQKAYILQQSTTCRDVPRCCGMIQRDSHLINQVAYSETSFFLQVPWFATYFCLFCLWRHVQMLCVVNWYHSTLELEKQFNSRFLHIISPPKACFNMSQVSVAVLCSLKLTLMHKHCCKKFAFLINCKLHMTQPYFTRC